MSLWWDEQTALLLQAYSANPVNNYIMVGYTTMYEEHNVFCGDSLVVYVRVTHDDRTKSLIIDEVSYTGQPSMFTLVAASLLAEHAPWHSLDEIMTWTFATVKSWWYVPSPKRQRSAVTPLLAMRNALRQYRGDSERDTYEQLLSSH
jgi:NifU-like protein involved in Fe-S cluster formation